jgi:hypothetical protein
MASRAGRTTTAFLFLFLATMVFAQTAENPKSAPNPVRHSNSDAVGADGYAEGFLEPGEDPHNELFRPFIRHLAEDQKQFWTAPFRMGGVKRFAPFAAFTGTLIASDSWISQQVPDSPSQLKRSQNISNYAAYSLVGVAGSAYLWGHITNNDHLRETGLLAGEAALNSAGVAYLLKAVTQRPRPLGSGGTGKFFEGGASFPSEHAAVAWSVASVLAHEYPGPLTKFAAYGLATAVTMTRVTGKQHFPSDVIVASALGWYFGRQVYRARHDPELGGAAWGNFSDSTDEDQPRNPQHMGSPYVPLDSWVYPALERLAAFRYVKTSFVSLKPWTRIECATQVSEARDALDFDAGTSDGRGELRQLEQEFAYELGVLDGKPNLTAGVDSIYLRGVSISGPALTDSYHLGQTVAYDFGRPFRRGSNAQIGGSVQAAAGPFMLYLRGEFQHAPFAPPLSDELRNVFALRDDVPVASAVPFDEINRAHLLEGYVGINLKGWQITAGRQSLNWGPGPGGSLLWSNNADPVDMVRIVKSDFRLPILGQARVDQLFGVLGGHSYVHRPYIYGQKIDFKPLPYLEIGFGRTVTIGGRGGDPLTFRNFFHSFFGQTDSTNSVPGDSHSSVDWVFHIPKLKNYLIFYGELYADDDFLPIQNLTKSAFRPGIYLTRFPGIPKLDFHAEAASTESPGFFNFGGTNRGNLNYWNQTYRDGYTNNGNLLGNTVGRMGRTFQSWFKYWISPSNSVQFAYKHSSVSADFIPGGGAWQDYRLRYEAHYKSGFYIKNDLQYEHISSYPILFDSSRRNFTATLELGFTLRHE